MIPFAHLWEQYKRLIKPNGAIVLTASQPFTTALIASNMEMFRYCWVWNKNRATGGTSASMRPMKAHEDICVFSCNANTYNPQMQEWSEPEIKRMRRRDFHVIGKTDMIFGDHVCKGREHKIETGRHPTSVLSIPALGSIDKQRCHPTQKPVALMVYLIRTYTNEGDLVLDNCAGSFTTGVACINTGRNFIGIEQDAEYFKVGERRINETQKPLMIGSK